MLFLNLKLTVENFAPVVSFEYYDIDDIKNMYYEDDPTPDEVLLRTRPIIGAYEKLREAFEARTGLALFLNYHNSKDAGYIYDDVSGCFWELSFSDVYMLTPEAKKLQETIMFDIQRYVVYE
ncbi:hypothetical protein [Jeotgalibaca porci]|uniref:hypothetical protein n=1 Tax=Jeotgalibaca porci TaxID=1868793 RepID=UPI00359FA4CD